MKRSGFKPKSLDEIRQKQAEKRKKVLSAAKKPKTAVRGNSNPKKTPLMSKIAKKKKLREKYDLPQITHTRWGTAKSPTNTDLLRGMLWTVFSKYIRDRDKDKPCISCGKMFDVKQAGHFVPVGGSSVGLWFDEQNVHGECEGCNGFDSFHVVPMRKNLIAMYGEDVVESLEARRHRTTILEEEWYVEKIKHYHSLSTENP